MPEIDLELQNAVYDELVAYLKNDILERQLVHQYWIGLAGCPGSGKTTLAEGLKKRLGDLLTTIPMDGYHYYRRELDLMDDPERAHARRGAPFTFNAKRFVQDLELARQSFEGVFPAFDHGEGDPVEHMIFLKKETPVVLVEGNYVLLDEKPWSRLKKTVFDETWFIDIPVVESNRRVYFRHIENGVREFEAKNRVENNDSVNANHIMAVSPGRADRLIQF